MVLLYHKRFPFFIFCELNGVHFIMRQPLFVCSNCSFFHKNMEFLWNFSYIKIGKGQIMEIVIMEKLLLKTRIMCDKIK